MTKLHITTLFIAGALLGCRVKPDANAGSSVKLSDAAKAALDKAEYTAAQTDTICSQDPLIVFIGNGEHIGNRAVFPLADKSRPHSRQKQIDDYYEQQERNHATFVRAITTAESDLFSRLQMPSEQCGDRDSTTTMATIFDGPGNPDSRIEVRTIDRQGNVASDDLYSWNGKALSKKGDDGFKEKFELNMARDLPAVTRAIRELRPKERPFTQTTYVLKTHGGVYKKKNGTDVGHVMFFDTHGPGKNDLASNLWFPVWTEGSLYDDICGRTASRDNPNFDFCSGMLTEFINISGVGNGNGSGFGNVNGSGVGNGNGSGVGNGNGSGVGNGNGSGVGNGNGSGVGNGNGSGVGNGNGSGVGNGNGSGVGNGNGSGVGNGNGSGVGNGNGSGVGNGNGSGVGNGNGSGVGNGNGSGVGNGNGSGVGNGNGSGPPGGNGSGPPGGNGSGPPGGNGSGPPGGNGSGAVNRLANYAVEMGDPSQLDVFAEVGTPKNPQGYELIGEAASYKFDSDDGLTGVKPLQLPAARLREGAKERQPMLVILDSCTMSNDLGKDTFVAQNDGDRSGNTSLEGLALADDDPTVRQPVVTLANDNTLYFFAVKYGLFDAYQYRALPYVFYWGLPIDQKSGEEPKYHELSTDKIRTVAEEISKTIGVMGLDRNLVIANNVDSNPELHDKLKSEYLILKPKVYVTTLANPAD